MLPAHLQELLTATVDGELTGAERRLVDKLLRESDEARVFHAQILRDAASLRGLPAASPSDDLAAHIVNLINDKAMMPTPLPMPRRKKTWTPERLLPWVSMATAAIVIIMVGVVSFAFFSAADRPLANQKKNEVATEQPKPPNDGLKNIGKHPWPNPNDRAAIEVAPEPREVKPVFVAKELPPTIETLPNPRVVGPNDIVAVPSQPESDPFRQVKIKLPVLLPLRDLDQAYPNKMVRDELKKDDAIHLDLFCKDSTRAAELLQAALKSRGQNMIVDAMAHERLKKKLKSEFVFYTESMTADEIAQLLEHLGADDKKAEAKKSGDGQFDKFMLAEFAVDDSRELSKLLGVPQFKLPKLKASGAIDPRKPLEANTVSQLGNTLPKGGPSRGEKVTLLISNGGAGHNPQASKEIKSFLDKRGDRKPGTVPMMLVLRTPG